MSLAGVQVDGLLTVSTDHGAAPVELALALRGAADPRRVVSAAAAQHLAAVSATGRPVTLTPPRTHPAWGERERF